MNETATPGEPTKELLEALARELRAGETLVWRGVPDLTALERLHPLASKVGFYVAGYAAVCVVIGLVLAAVATHSFYRTTGLMISGSGMVWGLIFLFMGFGAHRNMREWVAKTIYGLTAQRAIVLHEECAGMPREFHSFEATQLDRMSKRVLEDGSGDLIFEPEAIVDKKTGRTEPRGFRAIRDVDVVEKLVNSTLGI